MDKAESSTDQSQTPPPVSEGPISLTSKAVRMISLTREEEKLDPASGLRVAVRGGGCSGLEYALDFELDARDNDFVIEYDGLRVFVDPISARYLQGTEIDYSMGSTGAGFKFNNPNASGSCGCGSSFTV
jgi:iron-sulfur cluster assembly protein